jgi:hypothetical protein
MTMKLIQITTILLLSIIFVGKADAQETDLAKSGSFYSVFGFGNPIDSKSPFSEGMGLTGVANYSNLSPSISNPAHWGIIGYTQGSISVGIDNFKASDAVSTAKGSLLAVQNFQIAFPLMRNQLGASVSFTPVTRSDFQILNDGSFEPIDGLNLDPIQYVSNTLGSGGVNRFEVGAGYRLASWMSVGYAFSANILSQEQENTLGFSNPDYSGAVTNRSIQGYGFGHRFGIFINKGSVIRNNDQISAGATVSLPVSIDGERSINTFRLVENSRKLIELNEGLPDRDGSIQIPLEFNAGLTYNLSRFVNVGTELKYQNWSSAEFSFSSAQESYFKDRVRAGIGVQYHPYRTDQTAGFFSNFKYGMGASFDTGHLAINGNDIETLFLNAGIGLISRRAASSIDLNFHYGIRGTESSNLVKENIWGFTLSLNLAEFMFIRPQFQ